MAPGASTEPADVRTNLSQLGHQGDDSYLAAFGRVLGESKPVSGPAPGS